MVKRKNRLLTDFIREVRHTYSRFLSILLLSALAVAFLVGLRATAPDMKKSADSYFDQQNLMDLRIVSTLGLTEEDAAALPLLSALWQAGRLTAESIAVTAHFHT